MLEYETCNLLWKGITSIENVSCEWMLINVEFVGKGFMEQNQHHDHKDSIYNYQPKIIIECIIGSIYCNKDDAENQTRLDKIDVYFKKAGELRFVPHAALVDL